MTNDTCLWHMFDDQERNDITDKLHFIGGFSSWIFLWLLLAYNSHTVDTNRSYQDIGFFMISAWLRRTTPFLMTFIIDRKDTSRQEMPLCQLFGFLETFMAIHEVECLTHICIERYVVAKYIIKGWRMPNRYYYMFRLLSVLFAGAYSVAAAGMSDGYGPDFTCLSCTMNVLLSEGAQKYFTMGLWFLRSIKPVGFMIIMLCWAKQLEGKFTDVAYNRKQKDITKGVVVLTAVNVVCWTPIALIRASVLVSQHFFGPKMFSLPAPFYVKVALLLHWVTYFLLLYFRFKTCKPQSSHGCSAVVLLLLSPQIRKAAFNLRLRRLSELASETRKTE